MMPLYTQKPHRVVKCTNCQRFWDKADTVVNCPKCGTVLPS